MITAPNIQAGDGDKPLLWNGRARALYLRRKKRGGARTHPPPSCQQGIWIVLSLRPWVAGADSWLINPQQIRMQVPHCLLKLFDRAISSFIQDPVEKTRIVK